MRILITGSRGLIGTALRKTLHHLGVKVVGMDIAEEKEHKDYGSILDENAVFKRLCGVDGIVHLAAVSRVITGEKCPELCWETNVKGTQNLINAALNVERKPWLLYASSREVYGEAKQLPVEESFPLKPVNIYGESKVAAEHIVQSSKLQTSIVRFSNVYGGVHDHIDRVIPAFCRAAAEGCDIRVDGKNNQFDFTFLDDVIYGLFALILKLSKRQESIAPIHLVSGRGMSLEEVAQVAQMMSPYPIQIKMSSSRTFDVSQFCGNPDRAYKFLKWKSCIPIEEGMCRLYHQFRLQKELFCCS